MERPHPQSPTAWVEAGRYESEVEAGQDVLVISAVSIPHRLERVEGIFVLLVPEERGGEAAREIARASVENARWVNDLDREAAVREHWEARLEKVRWPILVLFDLFLTAVFLLQNGTLSYRAGGKEFTNVEIVDHGAADSALIAAGAYWRTITALTLHADWSHLMANIACFTLFAVFLFRLLGTGFGLLATVFAGALGNVINALIYRHTGHSGIGFSTAVFGALGLLVALQAKAARHPDAPRMRIWEWVLAPGAALALLAFLGSGGDRLVANTIDVGAHWWGMVAGAMLAPGCAWAARHEAVRKRNALFAVLALLLILGAWLIALRRL